MTRRVPLLAILAAFVSLLVAPATAAPGEGITLRGNRSAYVDLYVYVNETISIADVAMKTTGSYVGFFLAPAPANRDTVGALVMPRVGATGGTSVIRLGESYDLQAGKYRAFLLTDGQAEVTIPIDGQAFRAFAPRGRAPVSIRNADFDVAAGSEGRSVHVPVSFRDRSLVVSAAQATSSSLTAVDHLSACVTPTAACAAAARVPLARASAAGATLAPAGSYTAAFDVSRIGGMDAGSHVAGVVLVLTIGRQT